MKWDRGREEGWRDGGGMEGGGMEGGGMEGRGMEGGKMNGGRVWSWASSLFVVLCRHVVLVVSSLRGRVVVPSFCVLVVMSLSCIVVVAHTLFVMGVSHCGHGGCGVVWSSWLWSGLVVVWCWCS